MVTIDNTDITGQSLDWILFWYNLVTSKVYLLEEICSEDWFFDKKFMDYVQFHFNCY